MALFYFYENMQELLQHHSLADWRMALVCSCSIPLRRLPETTWALLVGPSLRSSGQAAGGPPNRMALALCILLGVEVL
jgi:hypothetical protein